MSEERWLGVGEYSATGQGEHGVVVAALGGAAFSVNTSAVRGAFEHLRESGAEAAGCMADVDVELPHRVLMLLTDGLAGDQQEIVRGAYSIPGASVPLVGGCAGDDLAMKQTHQFHGREVMTDAVGGGAPVAGFYSYGEIARTNGVSDFHNQTLVVLSVS